MFLFVFVFSHRAIVEKKGKKERKRKKRKKCENTVKKSKAVHGPGLLLSQSWNPGLMFDTPDLDELTLIFF